MFYEYDVEIPANTAADAPRRTKVSVAGGVLTRMDVQFPLGCAGLAHCQIRLGDFQLAPTNRTGSLKADDNVISFPEYVQLKPGENIIDLVTWNTDTLNAHTLSFRFLVQEEWQANPYVTFLDIRNALILLLRRIGVLV